MVEHLGETPYRFRLFPHELKIWVAIGNRYFSHIECDWSKDQYGIRMFPQEFEVCVALVHGYFADENAGGNASVAGSTPANRVRLFPL